VTKVEVRAKIPPDMAGAVPWFTPGISVADAHFMLSQLAEANLKPDETEQRWTFKHPELLELPAECRSSLLVHGHRVGVVRFKKLLLACNGARWANLPAVTVKEIVDKACVEWPSEKQGYPSPRVLAEITTELRQKKNDLCSITSEELEAYLASKMKLYTKHCSEESKAAQSYVIFMAHRRI